MPTTIFRCGIRKRVASGLGSVSYLELPSDQVADLNRMDPHHFWKLEPDPLESKKLDLDPLQSKNSESFEAQYMTVEGRVWSWRLKMTPWRVSRPVVAEFHHFDEEQDPDPH
jgi:hypothetical protein